MSKIDVGLLTSIVLGFFTGIAGAILIAKEICS